jgi:alkanesulfonate monooxygenase SsuD/methylene tetrahydromethanopterin reductase-like flavin-dependent oxidoreductase (luciferase family)
MEFAIGLPNTVPGTTGSQLTAWARDADARGFSSLGTIDRLVFPNYDPLIALAGAAAVTDRIKLLTSILIAPLHLNTALLAKQAASLDALSGGRLVLGLAPGQRDDDFDAAGASYDDRGARFDDQIEEMKRIWAGEERGFAGAIGPELPRGERPTVIVGGHVGASFRRLAEHADGWISGGVPPDQFATLAASADEAWAEAGREGKPHKMALTYFSLGSDASAHAERYLTHYYAYLGDDTAAAIAAHAATSPEMVQSTTSAFADAGCDEILFMPCWNDREQVELLAEAAGVEGVAGESPGVTV